LQQAAEFAVAEVQAHLESADLDSFEKQHGCTSLVPNRKSRLWSFMPQLSLSNVLADSY
jgi:hypothetical protein